MKLNKATYSQVDAIMDFIVQLVFKDEVQADQNETQDTALAAAEYISAYLKTDDKSESDREALIKNYKENNPYYKSLLDEHNIPPYTSRLAKDFDIILEPRDMVITYPYLENYKVIYRKVLTYFYFTHYMISRQKEENYRNYILMTMNVMTYSNLMDKWLENPYDIDIMDEENVDKFMKSFGIPYLTNLSLSYKRKIAKNLNRLITSKGSDKVIIDILDIFDFKDISIYKYYLVRDKTEDVEGGKVIFKHPRFFSHDIRRDSLPSAIKTGEYREEPLDIRTSDDPTWQATPQEIAAVDFDYVQTKFFSIETGFELTKETLGTVFLFNLLSTIRKEYPDKDYLSVTVSNISKNPIKLEHLVLTLQILSIDYYGMIDHIAYDMSGIVDIYQFNTKDNFKYNKELFGNKEKRALIDLDSINNFTKEEFLRVLGFDKEVHSNVYDEMVKEKSNYQRYRKLREAYKYKFIQKYNLDVFHPHERYIDYIYTQNIELYDYINNIISTPEGDDKTKTIENEITYISDVITDYLDGLTLDIGSNKITILSEYIKETIMVFKSFTATLGDLKVFIVYKEEADFKIIDEICFTLSSFNYKDQLPLTLNSYIKRMVTSFPYKDKTYIHDRNFRRNIINNKDKLSKLKDFYTRFGRFYFIGSAKLNDKKIKFDVDMSWTEVSSIRDQIRCNVPATFTWSDSITKLRDKIIQKGSVYFKDIMNQTDTFYFRQNWKIKEVPRIFDTYGNYRYNGRYRENLLRLEKVSINTKYSSNMANDSLFRMYDKELFNSNRIGRSDIRPKDTYRINVIDG